MDTEEEAFGRDTENPVINQRLKNIFREARYAEIQHKSNLNDCQE